MSGREIPMSDKSSSTAHSRSFTFKIDASAEPSVNATIGPAPAFSLSIPFDKVKRFLSGKPLHRPTRGGKLPKNS